MVGAVLDLTLECPNVVVEWTLETVVLRTEVVATVLDETTVVAGTVAVTVTVTVASSPKRVRISLNAN